MTNALSDWNKLTPAAAAEGILPTNGSLTWAEAMAARRPLDTPEALFAAADEVWRSLPEAAWQQAFDSHPRIGEQKAKQATGKSLAWSKGEQSTATPDAATLTELAEGNRAYEQKFGRIFIICATGKSAGEILTALERRFGNDPHTELHEAAEQQRQITQLRLRKWLGI
jgi:2-oxo-4-hydroxy-4-carboxy-5-ureidoimidazoline decarboxylase